MGRYWERVGRAWERIVDAWQVSWPWVGGVVLVLLIGAYLLQPRVATRAKRAQERAERQGEADAWLRGLNSIKTLRISQYRGGRLQWDIAAPLARVRSERFGAFSVNRLLLLYAIDPTAHLVEAQTPALIVARRAYFNPRRQEWIFLEGRFQQGSRDETFRALHWFTEEGRLRMDQRRRSPLDPLLRFWEPDY